MRNTLLTALLFGAALFPAAAATQPAPIAHLAAGDIQGSAEDGEAVFKGIPFAAAPIGPLRWREPQAVSPWSGIRDAKEFGPACMQGRVEKESEDCLTANIWAPQWPAQGKTPVMVWLHGGGNVEGWTSTPFYSGAALAKRGVIVVSVQYRLGVFGFFAHAELDAESGHGSGNYGLLDQIAALKWVKENIAAFGGDPDNVTVFGESAGAEDIGVLLASPLAQGLFARAIAESGPLRRIYPSLADQEAQCRYVAQYLRAPDTDQIAFLRTLPAADILGTAGGIAQACRPIAIDGHVLTEQPLKTYAEGHQHKVAFMLGNTLREGFIAMPPASLRQTVRGDYGPLALRVLEAYGIEGSVFPPPDPVYGDVTVQYGTDQAHRCRVMLTGLQHAATGMPFYQFQFARDFRGRPNSSTHTDEIPFVFGAPAMDLMRLNSVADRKLSDQMQSYWTNFARTGDPNGEGLPRWAAFSVEKKSYITFTGGGPAAGVGLREEQCRLFLRAEKEHPSWERPDRR